MTFLGETVQAPEPQTSKGALPWVAGGFVVLAAVAVYALETKGPEPIRKR